MLLSMCFSAQLTDMIKPSLPYVAVVGLARSCCDEKRVCYILPLHVTQHLKSGAVVSVRVEVFQHAVSGPTHAVCVHHVSCLGDLRQLYKCVEGCADIIQRGHAGAVAGECVPLVLYRGTGWDVLWISGYGRSVGDGRSLELSLQCIVDIQEVILESRSDAAVSPRVLVSGQCKLFTFTLRRGHLFGDKVFSVG